MGRENDKKLSVLFVCLGNICRSPLAEGAFRAAAEKIGLDVEVDSVGTAAYHIGDPPDPRAIAVAKIHGVDISSARGRQLSDRDFDTFTHIFALDTANMAGIKARAPRHTNAKIAMLLDVLEEHEGTSVSDPYYGDESDFAQCWTLVSKATQGLAILLKEQTEVRTANA